MKAPLTKRTTQEGRTGVAEEIAPEELEIADELIAERRTERPGETPEDMTPWQRPITGFIDLLNDWAGKLLCLLMVPLIGVVVFEVISRNAFGLWPAMAGMTRRARSGLGPRYLPMTSAV